MAFTQNFNNQDNNEVDLIPNEILNQLPEQNIDIQNKNLLNDIIDE